MSVPLSKIKTNQELTDIMFDQAANVVNTAKSGDDDSADFPQSLEFAKVIFVMEDVDAASKVVHRRAPAAAATRTVTRTVVRNATNASTAAGTMPSRQATAVASPGAASPSEAGAPQWLAPLLPARGLSRQPSGRREAEKEAEKEADGADGAEAVESAETGAVEEVEEVVTVMEEGPPKKEDRLKSLLEEEDRRATFLDRERVAHHALQTAVREHAEAWPQYPHSRGFGCAAASGLQAR